MTVRISDITSADWSPEVGNPGEIVTDMADIDQCIGIILATRKGSDPHRPLFGCDAWLWIDKPASIAIPNIIMEAVDSLEMWEPRIKLLNVTTTLDLANLIIAVEWQPKGEDVTIKTEVTL
jgi:uncharacterized protein